jgi:hypothetical protein
MQLRHGTREGARLAAVNNGCVSSSTGCSGTADEQRDALVASTRASLVGLADPDEMTIWLDYTAATVGSDVTVCVTYPLHSTTGLFSSLLDSKTLKSTSTMRIEQVATFSRSGGTSPC